MKHRLRMALAAGALTILSISCSSEGTPFGAHSRNVSLPSGRTVTVIWLGIMYGDQRSGDEMDLQIQAHTPLSNRADAEKEALDAFELIRSTCELWGLNKAEVNAYADARATGDFLDVTFTRKQDGTWAHEAMPGHSSRIG